MAYLYKVAELVQNIKFSLEESYPMVEVIGEVSEVKKNERSGHIYFSLKEDKTSIKCAIWKNNAFRYSSFIEEGKEVKIRGKISSYLSGSTYYINTTVVNLSKDGDIKKYIERLKQKLALEGVFDNKREIPKFPQSIGLITSKNGAVLGDIRNTLKDRFPIKVLLKNVAVQGEESIPDIIKALNNFNTMSNKPSYIIIARGGGSNDDLFHFNDELLVRTIGKSQIPIITAIGHENNSTLSDLASDKSTVTPTASVLQLPRVSDVIDDLSKVMENIHAMVVKDISYQENMLVNLYRSIISPSAKISNLQKGLDKDMRFLFSSIFKNINNAQKSLEEKKQSLNIYINNKFINYKNNLSSLGRIQESFAVDNILKRGFSIIYDDKKTIIKEAKSISSGKYIIKTYKGKKEIEII